VLPEPILLSLDPELLSRHPGFRPFRPGIEILRLHEAPNGSSAAILRYEPGAEVPAHRHEGYEHVMVLAGEQSDELGSCPAGTLRINPPGTSHHVVSRTGCLVLIYWEKPVVFTE
jgi:anti-sigma factor ChrR (cupin superfamily)